LATAVGSSILAGVLHDVLILPAKPDEERGAVAAAWTAAGGSTLRLDRFWDRPEVAPERVALYGPDTFALVVAQVLGLRLLSPPDDLLARAEPSVVKREVRIAELRDVLRLGFPLFAKPLVPKAFRAAVWRQPDELRAECTGLPDETPVIVSEIVALAAEARAWILDGRVVTCAVYEGLADPAEASAFVASCAPTLPLPASCVLDAGFVPGRGWCLLEANAAWGAGLNGCDPAAACACIDRATSMMLAG
jgi:hypothetical protein